LFVYARVTHGVGKEELLDMTPRYFAALVHEHRRRVDIADRNRDFMLAQVVAAQYNTGFVRFEEWRQPEQFMRKYASLEEPKATRLRGKQLVSQIERTMERAMKYQEAQAKRGIQ
jgi:vacuolar-type H+-ATPase subunit I/STV1